METALRWYYILSILDYMQHELEFIMKLGDLIKQRFRLKEYSPIRCRANWPIHICVHHRPLFFNKNMDPMKNLITNECFLLFCFAGVFFLFLFFFGGGSQPRPKKKF